MSQINGLSASPPSLIEVLDQHKQKIFQTMNVCKPGIIYSYDRTKGTAVIQVHYKRTFYDGSNAQYPLISDCPVYAPQGGGIHVGFPIKKGDECLILFADQNINLWYMNGSKPSIPEDGRMHYLSDAIALVGLNSLTNPLTTALLSIEGGLATATSKVAIDSATGLIAAKTTGASLGVILPNLVAQLSAMNSGFGDNSVISLLIQLIAVLISATIDGKPFNSSTISALGIINGNLATVAATATTNFGQAATQLPLLLKP